MERTVTSVRDHLNNLTTWKPDQKVLKVLQGTCFYPFAMLHEHQHILRHHVPMIQAIANCYEPEKRVFKFGGDELLFSLEDIVYIIGLPVDAEPVTGYDGNHKRFCMDLLGKYEELLDKNGKSKRSGSVKLSLLRKNFAVLPNKDLGKEELMLYVRAYVLYIIGSVVLPDKSGNYVPIMYLQLLKDQEDFDRYAWGAALLCHLHRCFDNFLKDSKCLAGSTFSLMLFAIERVPRLGLYMMGKEQPSEQELQIFFDTRPKDFPLLQGWANKLHPFSNNNHEGRDADPIVDILKNLQPHDICWEPYTRLDANFLPQHLKGQQHMGLSHTILLCFEKAVYHRPELCPKQFGVDLVKRPKRRDLKIITYNRGHAKDWSKLKKMKKYTDVWQGRRDSFIAHPPIPASSSHDAFA